jgi:hypothetical protein
MITSVQPVSTSSGVDSLSDVDSIDTEQHQHNAPSSHAQHWSNGCSCALIMRWHCWLKDRALACTALHCEYAISHNLLVCVLQDDAAAAKWFPVETPPSLAFDHKLIIREAFETLRQRSEVKDNGKQVGQHVTSSQLSHMLVAASQ